MAKKRDAWKIGDKVVTPAGKPGQIVDLTGGRAWVRVPIVGVPTGWTSRADRLVWFDLARLRRAKPEEGGGA